MKVKRAVLALGCGLVCLCLAAGMVQADGTWTWIGGSGDSRQLEPDGHPWE